MKEFWNETPNKIKKINKKKVKNITILAIISLILIIFISLYIANAEARNWIDINILKKEVMQENVTSIDIDPNQNTKVYAYNKYITLLNNNTLKIYNNSGKEEKNLNIEIGNPIFESNNRFLAIAEEKGQKLYFISGQDIAWQTQVEGNISKVHVNKNGYVAVVITDTSYKTIIELYNSEGKELFKTFLSSTRIVDVSISNDNKYLALAELDTSGTAIQSNIKIVSIEKPQSDTKNSISYIYNSNSNKLITNIKYQDKNKLICMYNDSVDIIENNNVNTIENIENKKITFTTIELNNKIAIVEEQPTGLFTADTELKFINVENEKENIYKVAEVTKEIYASGDIIALNLGTELHFVNTSGWLIKKYISKQELTNISIAENIAAIVYRDKIEIINI